MYKTINMKSKTCTKCGEIKSVNAFCIKKGNKDGLSSHCKMCNLERERERQKTKDGIITRIYSDQKAKSKKRNHPVPAYTKQELKEWCFKQDMFHELYDNWVASGYDKMMKPSCDRTDDYLGYSLDRLQLMTWRDNKSKYQTDRMLGINNKQNKSVCGINIISAEKVEFHSTRQAERETGINQASISKCCLGKAKSAGGFKWEFAYE
jgi:hypothetical protein